MTTDSEAETRREVEDGAFLGERGKTDGVALQGHRGGEGPAGVARPDTRRIEAIPAGAGLGMARDKDQLGPVPGVATSLLGLLTSLLH